MENRKTSCSAMLMLLLCIPLAVTAHVSTSKTERAQQLDRAIRRSDVQAAKHILANGPIGATGLAGMCWIDIAIIAELPILLEPMVKNGVPTECAPNGTMTPLQYAVHSGHLTSARELIRLGANVNAINPDGEGLAGYTPLRMAVFNYMKAKWFGKGANKNSDCSAKDLKSLILLMLKHGGDPDIRTPGSVTSPLLMTTEHGATDVVRWLLQAGADPNRAVGKGKRAVTPIEEAVYSPHSNAEVVKLLLYAGADPTVGLHTKGLLAKARKNMPKAVPLLKQYGAE